MGAIKSIPKKYAAFQKGNFQKVGNALGEDPEHGYAQKDIYTAEGNDLLSQILRQSQQSLNNAGDLSQNPLYQQAVQGTQAFLPGGEGFNPIQQEANRNFQQTTIPQILSAFGSGAKSSSALNQALAGAGQNLNTSLGSQLAQMQLQASQQAGGLAQLPFQQGISQAQLGLGTSPYAYVQKQPPFWQQLALAAAQIGGKAATAEAGGG